MHAPRYCLRNIRRSEALPRIHKSLMLGFHPYECFPLPAFFSPMPDARALMTRTALISTSNSLRVRRKVLRFMPNSWAALT